MYVNQTSAALQAYQPSFVNKTSAPTTVQSTNNTFEKISFESLLSDSDKRTIAAMEDFAKENGISDKKMARLENAIAMEKFFARKFGKEIPEIDKDMMGSILDGASSERIPLSYSTAQLFYDNFEQLRGISIKA